MGRKCPHRAAKSRLARRRPGDCLVRAGRVAFGRLGAAAALCFAALQVLPQGCGEPFAARVPTWRRPHFAAAFPVARRHRRTVPVN